LIEELHGGVEYHHHFQRGHPGQIKAMESQISEFFEIKCHIKLMMQLQIFCHS